MDHIDGQEADLAAFRVTWLGAGANLALMALKFAAGLLGGSYAMVADAVHSLSDLGSDVLVLIGLKISSRPPDESHPYGHGKVENVVTVAVGLMVAGAGVGIFWEAAEGLYLGKVSEPTWIALGAAVVSIVVKELLYRLTARVGKQAGRPSITANAWHHRTDALSSVAAMIGIGGAMLGAPYLDQIAAAGVAVFVFRAGALIAWDGFHDLIDSSIDKTLIRRITEILRTIPEIHGWHKLRTRRVGPAVFVDMHVIVSPKLSICEGHQVAARIKHRLIDELGVDDVTVHVECECVYNDCVVGKRDKSK